VREIDVCGQLLLLLLFWLWTMNYCFGFAHRKLRVKRTIRVPAISNKLADIPPDDYSWRKYGQKPIKGSPHPRYPSLSSIDQTPTEAFNLRASSQFPMHVVLFKKQKHDISSLTEET
jgi:hypothetical protein